MCRSGTRNVPATCRWRYAWLIILAMDHHAAQRVLLIVHRASLYRVGL